MPSYGTAQRNADIVGSDSAPGGSGIRGNAQQIDSDVPGGRGGNRGARIFRVNPKGPTTSTIGSSGETLTTPSYTQVGGPFAPLDWSRMTASRLPRGDDATPAPVVSRLTKKQKTAQAYGFD